MSPTIGDGSMPVYRFAFDDGSTRTTNELPDDVDRDVLADAVETFVSLGRDDPECDVVLDGFE